MKRFMMCVCVGIVSLLWFNIANAVHEKFYPPILKGKVADNISICHITHNDDSKTWYICERFDNKDGSYLVGLFIPNTFFIGVVKKVKPDGSQKNVWISPSVQKELDKKKKNKQMETTKKIQA